MRYDLNAAQLRALQTSPEVREIMERAGGMVADNARRLAPSGPGARSSREGIVTETVLGSEGWESHVGHVVGAYGFHLARVELGTRFMRPQPHLRPAATQPIDL
jgi:HK97 gp10 family phage protein